MRLRRVEPVLRLALRGPCAPARARADAPARAGRARSSSSSTPIRLLVAVSGGADSSALLIGLANLARELDLELHAAHLHHGLRGAEADADLSFVRRLCRRLGVPLTAARWDTRARMRRRALSGQAGLRVLRREFLLAAARRAGARAIATAHTADDQLETLLLRLGRGTGLAGLAGMRPRRGPWLKPLLGATRADIESDLVRAGEPWREDRSNRDPRYARNRVRHEGIPALVRALLPGVGATRGRAALARRAAQAAAEALEATRARESLASRVLSRAGRIEGGCVTLDPSTLSGLTAGRRRAVFQRLWAAFRLGPTSLTGRHLDALAGLIDSARGGAFIHLPGGWVAGRDRDLIRFRREPLGVPVRSARLPLPGRLEWGRSRLEGRWTTGAVARRRLGGKPVTDEYFAAEGLEGTLRVRSARSDERFVPFGRTRATRVGPFLSKQGVSQDIRKNPTVLADAGGILWVVGVRRSARAPVTAGTRRALWVHAEHHD